MKYGGTILYFVAVTVAALLAYACPASSAGRAVLAGIATVSFVCGIVGFTMREGWRKQMQNHTPRKRILTVLLFALAGAAAIYSVLFLRVVQSRLSVAFGFAGMWCLLAVFGSIGALIALRTQRRDSSESAPRD